ncbi:MAG: valine--tRNA ligase [Phycisphaerales bacterium]|nr:valine--tRNA ligase [Phycisphaerales bacterium]
MTSTMTSNQMPKSYTPAEAEPLALAAWDASGAFHAEPAAGSDDRQPYSIVIPPPNVTAALHLGHGLNNSLQDILIRVHRMRGFNTLWMPGTDHAGIATQTVVEKRLLQQEGRRRTDFRRDEFVARVQAWKDEYEATITAQLRGMGCSCDWPRQRFTMDDMCATAVREAFFQLFRDALIYRGKRLVNWDPVTLTALADDEVEMVEVDGSFWYLRYPLVHADAETPVTWAELRARDYPLPAGVAADDTPAWVTVATTRPETYLGDTAVAVNPNDPRAAALDGLRVRLPIVGRLIPIVADDYVVMADPESTDVKAQFATGFLKVTPAHDPNDWEIGRRHDLAAINVMAPDGTISDRHGWEDVGDARRFVGQTREDARHAVVTEFESRGLLEAVRPYSHAVGHSYRSHVPVEPYLSDQWYVKVSDDRLVGEAQRALADDQFEGDKPARPGGAVRVGDGELRFFPARYARTFQAWHDNLRDWCISRQLWWGHRIPVWSRTFEDASAADEMLARWTRAATRTPDRVATTVDSTGDGTIIHVCLGLDTDDIATRLEADGFMQDPDVLDTWFSSGLWPLSTMGWPRPDAFPETIGLLETFNPTSVLCTGRDIITLWVSRMVMFNRYFTDGRVPYRHVYINPMIQDGHGQRMSKSLGNGVDPRDIIHSHGADAMRFALAKMATGTQDCRLPVDMVSPYSGETFRPEEIISPAGYRVAAPIQKCPKTGRPLVSGYGAASGLATPSDDQPLARNASTKFDEGRNFCNKLWNATRFALSNITGGGADANPDLALDDLPLADRWIITRLHRTLHAIEDAVADYQFSAYAEAMYDFIWRDFCDWYLEAVKPTIREHPGQQQVLRTVLNATLRLLHPICPFVTESLWPHVQATGAAGMHGIRLPGRELLAVAAWPDIACAVDDAAAAETFDRLRTLIGAIRQIRSDHQVPPRREVCLYAPDEVRALIEAGGPIAPTLAKLRAIEPADARDAGAVVFSFEGHELALGDLLDTVDTASEIERLTKRLAELTGQREGLVKRLSNPGYADKAPPALVQQTRDQLGVVETELETIRRRLDDLGA